MKENNMKFKLKEITKIIELLECAKEELNYELQFKYRFKEYCNTETLEKMDELFKSIENEIKELNNKLEYIINLIQQLDVQDKRIINLVYIKGRKNDDVAEQLYISRRTFYRRLGAALEKLEVLEKENSYEKNI